MENNRRFGATELLLMVIGAIFLFGLLFVFHACGAKEDGSFMTCHWAERATVGVAALVLALAILHLFLRDARRKQGIDLALCGLAVLAAAIPGGLIPLCMMADMRCRSVMRPAVLVCAVLLFAAALADLLLQRKRGGDR